MAATLQPLNQQGTQIGAEKVSKAFLNSAARSGHLQIINNGKIELSSPAIPNQQTATKEQSLGTTALTTILKAFQDIKNSIQASNEKIVKFIDDNRMQKEIERNLEESNNLKHRSDNGNYGLVDLRNDLYEMFSKFSRNTSNSSDSLASKIAELTNNGKGGVGSAIKTVLQGLSVVVGGYILSKTSIGEDAKKVLQENFDKAKKLIMDSVDEVEGENESTPSSVTPSATSSATGATRSAKSSEPSTSTQKYSVPTEPSNTKTHTPVKTLPRPVRKNSGEIGGLKFAHADQKDIVDQIAAITLELQKRMGKRFLIKSGRRSVAYNKKAGGVVNSAHLRGTAVDICWENGTKLSKQDMLKIIPIASSLGVLGIGVYYNGGFLHLDVDKLGRRAWGDNRTGIPDWALDVLNKHRRNEFANGEIQLEDKTKTVGTTEETEKENSSSSGHATPHETASMPSATKQLNDKDLGKEERVIPEGVAEEEEEEESADEKLKKKGSASKEKKPKTKNSKFSEKQIEMANLIRQKFKDAGFSDIQAEAAVVNAMNESNLDPTKHNTNKEDSVGLFQLNRDGGAGVNPETKKPFPVDFLKNPVNNIDIIIKEAKHAKNFKQAKTANEAIKYFTEEVERPKFPGKEVKKRQATYAASAYPTSDETTTASSETPTATPEPKEKERSAKLDNTSKQTTETSSGETKSDAKVKEQNLFDILMNENALSRENMMKFAAKSSSGIINFIQKSAGLDESGMVRFRTPKKGDIQLVPYNAPDSYDPATVPNKNVQNIEKSGLDSMRAQFETAVNDFGEYINKRFGSLKSSEKSIELNKSKPVQPAPQLMLNPAQNPNPNLNRTATSGTGSIVPEVRDHESTLEKVQYNSVGKTGVV